MNLELWLSYMNCRATGTGTGGHIFCYCDGRTDGHVKI